MAHWFHRFVLTFVAPPVRWATGVSCEGLENVPEGGAVLVFNHPTSRDPVDVQVAYGGVLYFLGKKEAFEWPVLGWLLRTVGHQIPLDRQAGGNTKALEEAVGHLRKGHKIALAPEGTRSARGPLGRGRTGAARLALAAEVPVVPIAVHRGKRRARIVFGAPVDLSPWYARRDDPKAVRAAMDHVMSELARLLGEAGYDPATAPDYALQRGLRKTP